MRPPDPQRLITEHINFYFPSNLCALTELVIDHQSKHVRDRVVWAAEEGREFFSITCDDDPVI